MTCCLLVNTQGNTEDTFALPRRRLGKLAQFSYRSTRETTVSQAKEGTRGYSQGCVSVNIIRVAVLFGQFQ